VRNLMNGPIGSIGQCAESVPKDIDSPFLCHLESQCLRVSRHRLGASNNKGGTPAIDLLGSHGGGLLVTTEIRLKEKGGRAQVVAVRAVVATRPQVLGGETSRANWGGRCLQRPITLLSLRGVKKTGAIKANTQKRGGEDRRRTQKDSGGCLKLRQSKQRKTQKIDRKGTEKGGKNSTGDAQKPLETKHGAKEPRKPLRPNGHRLDLKEKRKQRKPVVCITKRE